MLLYKLLSVEEKNYLGQGWLIVCYCAHVYLNGKYLMKASKDVCNVRDIKKYYHDYVDKVSPLVAANHIDMDGSDKRHGVSGIGPTDCMSRRRSSANTPVTDVSTARKSKCRHRSYTSVVHD